MAVTVDDVQTTVGRALTQAERDQAAQWITDALVIISHGPDGRGSIDTSTLDGPTLDLVVREAVAARIKRPDSATQVSVSVDDAQVSRTYASGTGQIEILPIWWGWLLPDLTSGAFSVRPHYEGRS